MSEATPAAAPAAQPTNVPASPSAPSGAEPSSPSSAQPTGDRGARPRGADGRFTGGQQAASSTSDGDLDADTLAALETAGDGPERVRLGDLEVPLEALQAALDNPELLKKLKRKIKAAGEEREISLADAFDAVPKAEGWQKKQWEAAQRIKQVEGLVEKMKSDPIGAMTQILGSEDVVYDAVLDRLRYQGMSHEDRARIDQERELRRKAELGEEYLRRQEQERVERETAAARQAWQRDIVGALKAAGARGTTWEIQRAAGYVSEVLQHLPNGQRLTPQQQQQLAQQAAEYVRGERERERAAEIDGLDDDGLLKHIGTDLARRIARAYARQVRAAQGARPEPVREPSPPRQEPGQERPRRSMEDILDELQERDRRGAWAR